MDIWKMSLWQLFISGGPLMWPILLVSIFVFTIIIERLIYLYKVKLGSEDFLNKIIEKIKRNEIKEALQICDGLDNPIAHILKAAILKYDRPRQQITEAVENASLYEIPKLEKNLPVLGTLSHAAVLLGLLGTVTGLIRCFQVIQAKSIALHPVLAGDLAGGIWESLLVTAAGLVVAIPTYIAYNYLTNRVNYIILEFEKKSAELVNFLTE